MVPWALVALIAPSAKALWFGVQVQGFFVGMAVISYSCPANHGVSGGRLAHGRVAGIGTD